MSLYGAIQIGVAGLNAQSNALSVSSSNIANVNTVGYKSADADFSTLLTTNDGTGDISNAGVVGTTQQNIIQQGLLQTTQSPTDLAISGNGFFVVGQQPGATGETYYTRAGDFTPDSGGNLVNSSGYYLEGWPVGAGGTTSTDPSQLQDVNISDLSGKAEATSTMSIEANLQASTPITTGYTAGAMTAGTVTPDFQRTINVYDSQGGSQPLNVAFVKTGANTWNYEVSYQGDQGNITPPNTPIASGQVTFNADGSIATPTGAVSMTIPWSGTSGLQPQNVSLNLGAANTAGGLTQYDSSSTLTSSSVDGALFGNLSGVSIDKNGLVTAQFSNGLTQNIYQLPLATFTNPDGLAAVSGNAYTASTASGAAVLNQANQGGSGSVQSSSLESSTVDLATEFTNLITTQRAYSASSKIITTASEMMDQLMEMVH